MTDVKLPPLPETEYLLGIPERPYEPNWLSSMAGYTDDQMTAYARLAVLQERERCAKVCEENLAVTVVKGGKKGLLPRNKDDGSGCDGDVYADAIRKGE